MSAAEAATTWRMASQAELRRRVASAGAWVGVVWWLTALTRACSSRQRHACQRVASSLISACVLCDVFSSTAITLATGLMPQAQIHM